MSKSSLQKIYILILGMIFVVAFGSTFYFKQLYNDGAFWAYRVLSSGLWHTDQPYQRYTTKILQTPSVLAVNLGGGVYLATWLFCLGYMIYPFLMLGGFSLSKSGPRKWGVITLFTIVFLLAIVPNWTFSVSVANEAIVFSWPLIFYVVICEKPKVFWLLLLSLPNRFSYEAGFLFYIVALYLLYRERKLNLASLVILSGSFLSLIYHLKFRLVDTNSHVHFFPSLRECLYSPYAYLTIVFLGIFIEFFKSKYLRLVCYAILAMAFLFLIYVIGQHTKSQFWSYSYFNRVWSIPAAASLIVVGYEYLKRKNWTFSKSALVLFIIVGLFELYFEGMIFHSQKEIATNISGLVKKNDGCVVLSADDWNKFQSDTYIPVWSFSMVSILYGGEYHPRTIIFPEVRVDGRIVENNFCEIVDDHFHVKDQFSHIYFPAKGNFDYSRTLNAKIRNR